MALDNTDAVKDEDDVVERTIGHAVLCIGHEVVDGNLINGMSAVEYPFKARKGVLKIKDWDKISKKFIFGDDNFPVYQAESLEDPIFGNMSYELKGLIMNKSFPKFVWVTEISNRLIPEGEANGLILLDATEANISDFRPLILAICGGYVVQYDKEEKTVKSSPMVGGCFKIYDNNFKKL